ncbi:hypothetical protein G5C51_26560 [Streptomyces sp. A7024]|uniref:Serpin domain-containing protein n=1 Tax=Streptomyces coryli TaxID=1128680 RepID=A0A6G4U5K0_9ACTN|nr:serpin family protein [Streptomyces coryli]NGN67454.1 hypothetical protein [Streptomyces coryli]
MTTTNRDVRAVRVALTARFGLTGVLNALWVGALPAIDARLDLGAGRIGALLLVVAVGGLTAMPVAGRLADRWDGRRLLSLAAPAAALSLLGPALAGSAGVLMAAAALMGVLKGSLNMALTAQAVAVERDSGRPLISRLHGTWALGAVAGGAEGATAAELRAVLGVAGADAAAAVTAAARELAESEAVEVATGAWAIVPVYRAYRESLPDIGFGHLPADRNTAEMDAWIRKATHGLVRTVPARPDPDETRLLLLNALYLKARWEREFDPQSTADLPFTDARGTETRVPTMRRPVELSDAWTVPERGAEVVELGCKDGAARVRFVLGPPGAGAQEVLPAAWQPGADRRPLDADEVYVSLPRHQLRTNLNVLPHLNAMGVRRAASDDAEFPLLSPEPLKISQVAQEAVLKVAEKGVEAAAVTMVVMAQAGSAPRPRRIHHVAFDRPFGTVVLDPTGTVPLFAAWQASAPRDVS